MTGDALYSSKSMAVVGGNKKNGKSKIAADSWCNQVLRIRLTITVLLCKKKTSDEKACNQDDFS
jgi:hypothetical protein